MLTSRGIMIKFLKKLFKRKEEPRLLYFNPTFKQRVPYDDGFLTEKFKKNPLCETETIYQRLSHGVLVNHKGDTLAEYPNLKYFNYLKKKWTSIDE